MYGNTLHRTSSIVNALSEKRERSGSHNYAIGAAEKHFGIRGWPLVFAR